ncbi:MAG: ADOP family duplicated permease [Gemmatimonadaceae bacterium]
MFRRLWSELRYRLRAIVRRGAVERELDDELRFHLQREADKYARTGMAPADAARRARIALGGVERIKDDDRDARGVAILDSVAQDLRYAVRTLRLTPSFTLAVIVTLGLGIGATAGIFSVIDRLMFQPPALLHDPGQVSHVYMQYDFRGTPVIDGGFEYRRYLDLTQWTTSFSQAAVYSDANVAVGVGQNASEMLVSRASASLFSFFDVRPALGRFYSTSEDRPPGGALVAVLSYPYWQSRYGGRPDVLGGSIQIGQGTYTIIGVAPRGFAGMEMGVTPVAFVPVTAYAGMRKATFADNYNWGWLNTIVRRKPGLARTAATADATTAYRRSWQAERAMDPSLAPVDVGRPAILLAPTPLGRAPDAGAAGRIPFWVGAVALVTLIVAAANVAGLMLARAFRRRREIALRLALGVGRGRLVRQLLTEGLLLAGAGGLTGLGIGWAVAAGFSRLYGDTQALGGGLVDARTVGFCAAVTLLVGLATGLAPAVAAARGDLAAALKAGIREGTYQRSRARTALVILQGALCTALLIAAGLFVRSFANVRAMPLGYDVDHTLVVEVNLRGMKLSNDEQKTLMHRLTDQATGLAGVQGATQMVSTPFYSFEGTGLVVPGIDSVQRLGKFELQLVSPGYFRTVGTRILAGRALDSTDRKGSPLAIVVSTEMAHRLWPGRKALGQCVKVGADTAPCSTVVGVAENTITRGISHEAEANYYLAADQVSRPTYGLYVRVTGRGAEYAEPVRRHLQTVMPGISYVTVLPFAEIVGTAEQSWQIGATMFTALGVLALVLAAIGIYSVIAYNVTQRTHEIGVRIALGARVANLTGLVLRDGLRLGAIGMGIGVVLALVAGRWLAPLLFDVSPRDPAVLLVVSGVLVGVTCLACAIPAFRAARVDPNVALRAD